MCNPAWTAWECIWSIHFLKLLFIIIGPVIFILAILSRDISSIMLDQKPFLKIKDFEFNPLISRKIRLGLLYIGITTFVVGFLWIFVVEIQTPFVSRLSPTSTSSLVPSQAITESERTIESFPIKIFDYDGVGDSQVKQGWAKLAIAFSDQKANYIFDYDLPSDGTFGYAGLDFRFEQTQDLSVYKAVRVVLDYFDDASQCEFFIKDISFQGDYFLLGKNTPPGGSLKINGTEYTYEIPLSIFTKLNFKAVYEVGMSVDTDITQGKHSITVKQIIFVR